MKITELINKLNELKELCGDINVEGVDEYEVKFVAINPDAECLKDHSFTMSFGRKD